MSEQNEALKAQAAQYVAGKNSSRKDTGGTGAKAGEALEKAQQSSPPSWYERGKLSGKAVFNLALGFAGVEFDWGELLNVAKWVPEAVELVRAMGSLGRAIELGRALGGIGKAVEFLRAVGGVEQLLELAEAAGGFEQLAKMAQEAGGFPKLMELTRDCGGLPKLVQLAKDIGVTELKEYLDILKAGERIRDPVQTLEDLLNEFKSAQKLDRVFDLSRDAAHGGKISLKTIQEARVGLALEEAGKLPPPITRCPNPAAEFIDGDGVMWDVKGFFSGTGKGAFKLVNDLAKVNAELAAGENVIIDTSKMNPADIQALRNAVGNNPRVRWYPP